MAARHLIEHHSKCHRALQKPHGHLPNASLSSSSRATCPHKDYLLRERGGVVGPLGPSSRSSRSFEIQVDLEAFSDWFVTRCNIR